MVFAETCGQVNGVGFFPLLFFLQFCIYVLSNVSLDGSLLFLRSSVASSGVIDFYYCLGGYKQHLHECRGQ